MSLLIKARKGLVPKKRQVTRGGKTFQTTVWVRSGKKQGGDIKNRTEQLKEQIKQKTSEYNKVWGTPKELDVSAEITDLKNELNYIKRNKKLPPDDDGSSGGKPFKVGDVKYSFGRDANGNKLLKIKSPEGGFSIQTNTNLPAAHSGGSKQEIEKQTRQYVAKHGSDRQKQIMGIDLDYGEEDESTSSGNQDEVIAKFNSGKVTQDSIDDFFSGMYDAYGDDGYDDAYDQIEKATEKRGITFYGSDWKDPEGMIDSMTGAAKDLGFKVKEKGSRITITDPGTGKSAQLLTDIDALADDNEDVDVLDYDSGPEEIADIFLGFFESFGVERFENPDMEDGTSDSYDGLLYRPAKDKFNKKKRKGE